VDQLAQRARAEALALEAGKRAAPRDAADFGADVLQIVLADRLGDVLDRGAERARPRKGIALGLGSAVISSPRNQLVSRPRLKT